MTSRRFLGAVGLLVALLAACDAPPPAKAPPCFTIHGDSQLRAKDASKTLEELAQHIHLSAEDEALRDPKSIGDIRAILRRDVVYFFASAAASARALDTVDGRFMEAQLELLLGESQLVASQVLSTQEAWVGLDLRIARANLASEGGEATTDRGRMLAQLIRVVEEGNKIADALGAVAPSHLARGAEVIRKLRTEAAEDPRTFALVAEYHRLRGEWTEFDVAMKAAAGADRLSRALCYLRGMEQLERHRRPDLGATILRGCLEASPKFVRAQAGLVLMATNPAEGLRELNKLKQMNQDHYLVMLLEPTLAADQELLRMQNRAARNVAP
jgi:hypothetical protein